ncbi:MAG: chemotaxis response regulator protein-glutamate methylesterase [Ignavibacteriaceae bacterium]
MINVIVVDDSAFMRKSISIMLESDEGIKVIAAARDGEEGYNLTKKLHPDLVTMDIEMPKMDGLTALQKIMQECPVPVIMVSSLTTEGAESTIKAFEYGALDFIPKELSYINVNIIKIKEELIRKVKEIVNQNSIRERLIRLRKLKGPSQSDINVPSAKSLPKIGYKAIAMGISTGGPLSLQKIIPLLSKKINCPVFIVQHMPPKFTKSLADRLNSMSELEVKEAENKEEIKSGVVYIAPGGLHMTIGRNNLGTFFVSVSKEPSSSLHRPSVDVMIDSVVDGYGKNTLGVIMTGMGKDGLEGIRKLKHTGGYCLAQDEESSVVYGMPKAIAEAGFADVIAPLDKISEIINKAF